MSLSFTFIDILVVGVVIASAFYAGYRGLVSETLSIFAWAAAAFATLWFGPSVVPAASGVVSSPILAMVAAYALVFLAVLIPLSFLSFRFSQQVKSSQVGTLDRSLGAAFGLVRGIAIIGFAYLILASFVKFENQPESVRTARTLSLMQASTEVILSLVPRRNQLPDTSPPTGATASNAPPTDGAAAKNAPGAAKVSPEKTAPPNAAKPARKTVNLAPKPKPGTVATKSQKKPKKTYGERDRRALDNLIETTGGNSKP